MARLASQAKAGFFPTPDSVVSLLKTKISFEEGVRILDPCCGKGKTLAQLAGPTIENINGISLEIKTLRSVQVRKIYDGSFFSPLRVAHRYRKAYFVWLHK